MTAFWALIEFPSFLYSYKYTNDNLVIYSDNEIPNNIEKITNDVLYRLKKSSLYKPDNVYRVHLPTKYWRWALVTLPINYQNIGGFCTGFRRNVFMRPTDIANNKILFPGIELADLNERDLTYFITHEIGHAMVIDQIGLIEHMTQLPRWLEDGYPDYIAKKTFDFGDNLAQYKRNEWRLTKESGLYVRYHLFVAYLMDKKGDSIEYILKKIPDETAINEALASYTTSPNTVI